MTDNKMCTLWTVALALSISVGRAQSPQQIIQQVVNSELTADQVDHSHWTYLEEIRKPKEHLLQWVAATPQGDVQRLLRKNEEELSETQQRELIDKFVHDSRAQNKQVSATNHDDAQIDDFLRLLPVAFIWTRTGATATTTSLHFEPAPNFHPPTREARVFSGMSGDLVADSDDHRVRAMSGHLIHDVSFGGGLLGRLKEGSSFSLEQQRVGPSLWQLSEVHVHLEGNALLFKSISLEQDDERCRFEREPAGITLDQAANVVMQQPERAEMQKSSALRCR